MTAPPPRRPWWKRKRTWAAGALWLAVAYPFSAGPSAYGVIRGWVPNGLHTAVYSPLMPIWRTPAVESTGIKSHFNWWCDLARRHAASH